MAEKYRAEWQRDASLRAEFADSFEAYAAYRAAVDRGSVRVLGGGGEVKITINSQPGQATHIRC